MERENNNKEIIKSADEEYCEICDKLVIERYYKNHLELRFQ